MVMIFEDGHPATGRAVTVCQSSIRAGLGEGGGGG
jgi:hypothetical protein